MKTKLFLTALTAVAGLASSQAHAADPVYLKNFREIWGSYVSATGVDGRDQTLRDLYRFNIDRLPKLGLPAELSSDVVLATTELGGAFCKQAVVQEKALPRGQRLLFGYVDFARGPSQFTTFLKETLADHLAQIFWQRNVLTPEVAVIGGIIDKTIAAGGTDTPEATESLMHSLCTTYASSISFLVK